MIKQSKWVRALIAAFALMAGLAAAGPARAAGGSQNALVPLNVGVASLCSCWLTLYVAKSQGLFEAEGLAVNVTTFNGGSQSMAALAAGDIQIVGGAGVRGVTARLQGLDTLAVFAQTDGFYLQLMAVKPGLKTLGDLRGKTVAVRPGALSDQFLRFLLRRDGLTDSVSIVGTPTEQAELALVQTRAVDAVMTNEPNATLYLEKNLATPIINFNNTQELKAHGLWDLVPSHTLTYLSRESWLKKPGSADATKRFVAAMGKAMAMIRQNPEIAVQTWGTLGAGASMSESNIISESVRTIVGIFSEKGCLSSVGMENIQKVSAGTSDLKNMLPFGELATNDYFPEGVCQ